MIELIGRQGVLASIDAENGPGSDDYACDCGTCEECEDRKSVV